MINPIELARPEVEVMPHLVWNAFIKIIADSETKELNSVQSAASLAFYYDLKIQNGGHLQFFETATSFNQDPKPYFTSVHEALETIGAISQACIFSEAENKFKLLKQKIPAGIKDNGESAEFADFDEMYYQCFPDINCFLGEYLDSHLDAFVKIV